VALPVFCSPDLSESLGPPAGTDMDAHHVYVDRKKMAAFLLEKVCACKGVELRTGVTVIGPIMDKNRVCGARVRNASGKEEEIRAEFVADASGLGKAVGSRVPYQYPHEPDLISDDDLYVGYKEIVPLDDPELSKEIGNRMVMGFGGGMGWVMTYWEGALDVGAALPKSRGPHRLRALAESLKKHFRVPEAKPLRTGAGSLPARRCRTRLAGDGFVLAGDAACQVNPSCGGGISPALLAGFLAGKAIVQAAGRGRTDVAALWDYPCEYVRLQGAGFAGLDAFRRTFQGFPEKDIVYCFKNGLITYQDMAGPITRSQAPAFHVPDGIRRLFSGYGRPDILLKLFRTAIRAGLVSKAYAGIPAQYDMEAVAGWEKNICETLRPIRY
jgi:flavin-dependent dehydrogenase